MEREVVPHIAAERQASEYDPRYERARDYERTYISGSPAFAAEALEFYNERVNLAHAYAERAQHLRDFLQGGTFSNSESIRKETLNDIQDSEIKAQSEIEIRSILLRRVFRSLSSDMLSEDMEYLPQKRQKFLKDEVMAMISGKTMLAELKGHFGEDFSQFSFDGFMEKILDDSFSDEFLYEAALHHESAMASKREALNALAGESKERFKSIVENAVASGNLPPSARDTLSRVDSMVVGLEDRLNSPFSGTRATLYRSGYVSVMSDVVSEDSAGGVIHSLSHEYLHEISGKSITLTSLHENETDGSQLEDVSWFQKKLGLRFFNPEARVPRLGVWINEAVTEWLALELFGYSGDSDDPYSYKGSLSYVEERKELDRLFAAGLERNVVIKAYFENFVSNQSKSEKGKYFSEFVKQVNDIEGKYGFSKLQNKYLLREIVLSLGTQLVMLHPAEDTDLEGLPLDISVIEVDFEMGIDERSAISQRYFRFIRQSSEDMELSKEKCRKNLENSLRVFQKQYGKKFRYTISDRDQSAS